MLSFFLYEDFSAWGDAALTLNTLLNLDYMKLYMRRGGGRI